MKILLFSDLHAHAFRSYASMTTEGRNSRLQDALNILNQIEQICRQEDVHGVLFGGDLFHIRPGLGNMKIPTFNAVFEAIARIKLAVSFVGLLVGNHDQGNKSGTEHSIYVFQSLVTVMDRLQWYVFESNGEYVNVLAVPATTSTVLNELISREISDHADREDFMGPHIMLGHLGIEGASVGTNFVMRGHGAHQVGSLHPKYFDQVFLGDYHKPQKLADNVQYIGATHHHNWSDEGQPRGCLIWDTETDKIEFRFLAAPRFVKCPVEEWKDLDLDWAHDGFVRITYDRDIPLSTQDEITKKLTAEGVRVVEFFPNPKTEKKTLDVTGTFHPSMDQESMVEAYVDAEQPEDLDEEMLLVMGRDLFTKAVESAER